jgi:hypothetical protein
MQRTVQRSLQPGSNSGVIASAWNPAAAQAAYDRYTKAQLSCESEPHPSYTPPRMTREQLDRLVNQIVEAEKQRTGVYDPHLEARIMSLRSWRNFHYWYTFRINNLPQEILSNIFHYVCWSTVGAQMGVQARVWITGVCRNWRNIALADPTLWNAIWFKDEAPYERSMAWFQRAGSAPIDLRINERDTKWNPEEEHRFTGEQMRSLMDQLFTKLSQIRMLIVVVDTWPPALAVLDKLHEAGGTGEPINLERIEIHRTGRPYMWDGPGYEARIHENPIPLCGGNAPKLKYLALNSVSIHWHSSPLANLTTLDLRRMALQVSPDLHRFREMLVQCPNLNKLALDGFGPRRESNEIQGLQPITLPTLRTFVIGDVALGYSFYVLTQFDAPNVRDLTLMNMNGEDYSHLFALITGKFPDVRLLTLYTVEVANHPDARRRTIGWLKSIPNLGYLRCAQIKRHVFDAFLEDPSRLDLPPLEERPLVPPPRQILCPRFNVVEYQSIDTDIILSFGKGRKELGVPLGGIYINDPWLRGLDARKMQILRTVAPIRRTPLGETPEELAAMTWETS